MERHLEDERAAVLRDMEVAVAVELQDGREVLRVLVEEVFGRLAGDKLVTEGEDGLVGGEEGEDEERMVECLNGGGAHELAEARAGVAQQGVARGGEALAAHVEDDAPGQVVREARQPARSLKN